MLVLILSLKLSIVPYAVGPESRGDSRTAFANISMSSCFPSFIVHWIFNFVDQPTHENHENWYPTNKSDFTVIHSFSIFYLLFTISGTFSDQMKTSTIIGKTIEHIKNVDEWARTFSIETDPETNFPKELPKPDLVNRLLQFKEWDHAEINLVLDETFKEYGKINNIP